MRQVELISSLPIRDLSNPLTSSARIIGQQDGDPGSVREVTQAGHAVLSWQARSDCASFAKSRYGSRSPQSDNDQGNRGLLVSPSDRSLPRTFFLAFRDLAFGDAERLMREPVGKLIYLVAGARPNFMKIAPIARALSRRSGHLQYKIVHTGQHYDREMSDVFFEELGIQHPDHHLECGGGSHAEQTAKIMVAFERICRQQMPACVLVVGDVNSTLACSIVAKKLHIPVAHVEAGLRSGDRSMPEEINRLVTDSISDWYFCTEPAGVENLLKEGKPAEAAFHVGHVMVDNLLYQREQLAAANTASFQSTELKGKVQRYGVVTLHRPSNVDDREAFTGIVSALNAVSKQLPLIFPVHPRTRANLQRFGLTTAAGITLTTPLSYMDFLNLWKDATLVMTDSGGLQEETTALDIPCLTLRHNTERPITLEEGTNTLVGNSAEAILNAVQHALAVGGKSGKRPALWDGHAAERIVQHLEGLL